MLISLTLPSLEVQGIEYVTLNPHFSDLYWKEITVRVRHSIGAVRVTDPMTVRGLLSDNFDYLFEQFQLVITQAAGSVSFLIFVHRIHESSVLISNLFQEDNQEINAYLTEQDLKELPLIHRVLKLIMEAILPEQFDEEIAMELVTSSKANRQNMTLLEELLYLGCHTLEMKEFINIATIFQKSVALVSSWKKPLSIRTAAPYHQIFDTIQRDISEYPNIRYEAINEQLDAVLDRSFGLNLSKLQKHMPGLGTGIISRDEFLQELGFTDELLEAVRPFYAGLTLTATNKLPLLESFKKMQTNNRLIYRPLIEFADREGNIFWIVGSGKTHESINALQTNALLWGQLPPEWTANEEMKELINDLGLRREALMIEQIADKLITHDVPCDTDIKSLKGPRNQGFNIVKNGPGEIDVIFLDEKRKVIYVCECKNNRPRFEVFYWKSEYTQFTKKYEPQLYRKYEWTTDHKELVQVHFSQKLERAFDFTDWVVEGLFFPHAYYQLLSCLDHLRWHGRM